MAKARNNADHDTLRQVYHAIYDDGGIRAQIGEIRHGLLGDPSHPEVLGMCARVEAHMMEHTRIDKELAQRVKDEAAVLAVKTRRETKRSAAIIAGLFSFLGVIVLWVLENIQLIVRSLGVVR